jgi:protocatechuate 3,4-dioxygenase beta subunit
MQGFCGVSIAITNTFLAKLLNYFIPNATADLSTSFVSVGGGTSIALIQIDSSGNQVGSALGTGTTASDGSYNISLSTQLVTGANYVIQATGSSGQKLNSIVTGSTVNVNPITNATQALVVTSVSANSGSLSSISVNTITALQNNIQSLLTSPKYAATSTSTASSASSALVAAANANEEVSNAAGSIGAPGTITGVVKDASGNPVPGINIQILDYGNWVLRAETITAADGSYTINAPLNKTYILGAVNETSTSTLASQWYTAGGGSINEYSADQIVLSNSTAVTKNFTLGPGIRMSGVVTGGSSNLAGVKVIVRDFYSNEPVAKVFTGGDGSYTINVGAGKYTLAAVNVTANPYATQIYLNNTTNANNYAQAAAINLSSSTGNQVFNFALPAGYQVAGNISDPTSGVQTGIVVRIYDADPNSQWYGSTMESVRSDMGGNYSIWLVPKTGSTPFYSVESRGQASLVSLTQNQTAVNFAAAVAVINGKVVDQNNNAVPQAKIFVYSPASTGLSSITGPVGTGAIPVNLASNANTSVGLNCATTISGTSNNANNPCKMGLEISNSDGTFTVYSSAASVNSIRLFAKLDNGSPLGSVFYTTNGTTATQVSAASAVPITVGQTTNLSSNIVMPLGVLVTGTITDVNGNPAPNYNLQLRGYLPSENFSCTYNTSISGGYNPSACSGGAAGYPTHMFATISTRSDGTFQLSVPAANYYARVSNGYSTYFATSGLWKSAVYANNSSFTATNSTSPAWTALNITGDANNKMAENIQAPF